MQNFKYKTKLSRIFKKSKLLLRSIVFILIFALLFTSLPMDGIIALAEQAIEESKLITVVEELEQYRTEFSKTYLKSDGTLEAVVSANPIHFNDDGEWIEIDSTLEITENDDGKEVYQNKKGKFKVNLPTQLESGSEVEIENGDNKISIKLLENKKSKGEKNNDKKQKAEKLTKDQRKRMTAGELFEVDNNQLSALEYTEAYSNTNLRYDVTPNEVKESIILQKAPNKKATYSYEITADGLTAVLNGDNSIDFFEGAKTEGAEPVFSMPAPHMFDSNDEYSYDIVTTLENKDGKYLLTYKPGYEWLKAKERAYPVTLDPTVTVNSGIQDSYTFSGEGYGDSYTGYEQQLKVGTTAWIAPNDYWQTYLKFTDLPQIPYEDYRIDSAYLMLTPKATTGGWQEMELGVYELTEDWKNHQTGKVAERITFNNAPADVGYSTATASVARGGADNGVGVGFEIAHIVEKWYDSPETNYGIKLAAHLEASQYNDNLVFHSSRSTTGTAPYLSLTYTEFVPVERIEITGKQERIEYLRSVNAFEVSATVYPENATNKEVIWESTNESAAYYDDGIIWAAGVGTTTITAKSADNNEIIDSFDLEVYNIPIETITITNLPENNTLETGMSHQLAIEAGPDNASDKYFVEGSPSYIIWSSDNTDVAYVDNEGEITTGCYGTTTITAAYGDVVDSFTLTVTGIETTDVYPVIEPENKPMYVGETWVFMGAVEPFDATDKRTVCTSSNPDVVGISTLETSYSYHTEHTISALSEGTATIRLEAYNDSSVYYEFNVTVSTFDKELGLNLPYNNTLAKGDTWQITTNPNNTIAIGDSSIISNAGNGYITALKPGTTTIEISTRSGTVYFANREITVIESYDLQINNIPTHLDDKGIEYNAINVGERYEGLGITITPTPPTNAEIVWSSSDESIAEVYYDYVRARVVLIGKSQGTVTIYADIVGENICGWTSFELTVENLKITKIELDPSDSLDDNILYFGEKAAIKANVHPQDYEQHYFDAIDWKTTNSEILFLSGRANNKYVADVVDVSVGTVNVWAEIDNVSSAKFPITVRQPTAKITKLPTNGIAGENAYILKDGTTHQLGIDLNPKDVEDTTYIWESSNENVATIDANGKITTITEGETVISYTAKIGGTYSATDVFILKVIHIDDVCIENVPPYDTTVGDPFDLTVTVTPYYSYVQGVTWSLAMDSVVASNEFADITQSGKLTLKAEGFITVFARSNIDNTVYDYFHMEIHPKAEGIEITNVTDKKLTLEIDKNYQLQYNISPNDVLSDTIKWKSSNEKVAKVNNNGLITTVDVGTTYVEVFSTKNENICDGFWLTVVYYFGDDHGDIFGESTYLGDVYFEDKTISGHLGTAKDIDCFYFVSYRNCVMEIYSQGNTDTYANLYDEATNWLISDDNSQDDNNFKITYHLEAGKQYYLRISRASTNEYIDYNLCFKFIKDFYVLPNNCNNMIFRWYNESHTNYPNLTENGAISTEDYLFMNKFTAKKWKEKYISNESFSNNLKEALIEGSLDTIENLLSSNNIDDFSISNIGTDIIANIIVSLLLPYIDEYYFDTTYEDMSNNDMMRITHSVHRIMHVSDLMEIYFTYEKITNYYKDNIVDNYIYGLEGFRGSWNIIVIEQE